MANKQMTIKVPGKLMVAGEFAVLEPYHKLAVMAVDRYVYASLSESNEHRLTLEDFALRNIPWTYQDGKIHIESNDGRLSFIKDALEITCTYLKEQGEEITPFHLSTRSELDDASGVKYGLGSSAAIVTSVVSGLLNFIAPAYAHKETIFRLAALSHVLTQGNGSGADIAASTFGGFRQYSSFQAEWLLDMYRKHATISEIVEMDWEYYQSEEIHLPESLEVCVGWTGSAASTKNLVHRIRLMKKSDPSSYHHFLKESEEAVHAFLTGMNRGEHTILMSGVKRNRQALAQVGEKADTPIETPMLAELCNLAEQLGGAGKPSGAGGGDCGIAFMNTKDQASNLFDAWEKAGIKPLQLQPSLKGEHIIMSE